ncbi:MAG: hypothetical protein DRH50_10985 [Deltaproteobacteria bacterium]|nr:MAG: hypothetical protein DRH50_10985 [Deltaproteobacteria bacterium]
MQGFQLALRTGRAPSFRYKDLEDGVRHAFYTVYWSNQGRQYHSCVTDKGMFVRVLSKTRRPYDGQVFDLTVKDDHSFTIDGVAVRNCLKDFDTCPICESGQASSYIVVGTVISHKVWTDRAGNKHANEKVLFVAKGRARQRLLRQIGLRDGDLTGCVYEMARGSSSTECASGEDFEFIGRLSKAKMKKLVPKGEDAKEFLKPFNYEEIFAPKSAEELRKLVGGEEPVGSEEEEVDDGVTTEPEEEGAEEEEEATSIEDLL